MCYVTVVTYIFIVQENKKKRNIKLRKIDKNKRKNIQAQAHYNTFEAFQYNLVCKNQSTSCRNTSWIKFIIAALIGKKCF